MATYKQIVEQIAALQEQANTLKKKEVEEVVKDIREKIATYGLTPADLGFREPKQATGKVAVKYRDSSGNSWTGRGKRPGWLVAHIESGKKAEDFLVA
ncbi:H-NS family nucleoid-associated regulatory protein [Ralstonia pseudosolanacearum]|uniref:H-NS histone family protein n=1 Tax=Ralstonia pseudosolanacearum TaxID=1310165 RepID=UPI003CF45BC6